MTLCIDLGNSRFKWAQSQDLATGAQQLQAKSYQHDSASARAKEVLHALASECELAAVTHIHAVSVLGEAFEQAFIAQLKSVTACNIVFHAAQKNHYGVRLAYSNVQTYGADRYAALIAAHHAVSGDKIVIDCGTATTIDMLTAQGIHQGGLIMPGVHLMLAALTQKTTGIRAAHQPASVNENISNELQDIAQPEIKLLCDNTQDAVYSGSVLMMQHGIHGLVKQLVEQADPDVTILITGGASYLLPQTLRDAVNCHSRPQLVLDGVHIMQG